MEFGLGLTKIIPAVLYLSAIWVILLTLLYKIEIGIYFLVPLLPLQNVLEHITIYPMGKDILDILYLALLIKWFLDRGKNKKTEQSEWQKSMNIVIGLIFVWTLFTLWFGSFYLGDGPVITPSNDRFVTWKNYIMLPILYLIIVNNIKDEKQVRTLLILMSVAMLFMGRNFYHNFSSHDHSHYRNDIREAGTFSYLGPNELAVFYAQNTVLIFFVFLGENRMWRRVIFFGAVIFNTYCILFLYSRSGYLAILSSLIFLGFMKDKRILVALALFFIFWRSLVPNSVVERVDMTREEAAGAKGADQTITDRYAIWHQALDVFIENPILGIGFNGVPHLDIRANRHRNSVHNGYLELALEQGIVGLGIYLTFFVFGIRYGWRLYQSAANPLIKGLGLGFVGCVIAVLTGNIAGSYWFYMNVSGFYWANLALVVRALELQEQKKHDKESNEGKAEAQNVLRFRPRLQRFPQTAIIRRVTLRNAMFRMGTR